MSVKERTSMAYGRLPTILLDPKSTLCSYDKEYDPIDNIMRYTKLSPASLKYHSGWIVELSHRSDIELNWISDYPDISNAMLGVFPKSRPTLSVTPIDAKSVDTPDTLSNWKQTYINNEFDPKAQLLWIQDCFDPSNIEFLKGRNGNRFIDTGFGSIGPNHVTKIEQWLAAVTE